MIERFDATKYITSKLTDELVVASLGNAKFDLFNAQDRPRNFYMWNSMGMACSFALGLAMARPNEKVICLDGDGSLLMNLGSLATETVRNPKNFIHIVWDNRSYELTGKQPTATAFRIACIGPAVFATLTAAFSSLAPTRIVRWRAVSGEGMSSSGRNSDSSVRARRYGSDAPIFATALVQTLGAFTLVQPMI